MTQCSQHQIHQTINFPLSHNDVQHIASEIESIFHKCAETTYIDAVNQWAEQRDLDVSAIPKCLSNVIVQKIKSEATAMNLMKTKAPASTLDFLM